MGVRTIYQHTETSARRKRLQRAELEQLPAHRLSAHDQRILWAVYAYRVLTADQLTQLLFPTKTGRTQCQHRLKLLFHHGYLHRTEQLSTPSEGPKPLLYTLDQQGAAALAKQWDKELADLAWHPRELSLSTPFLDHLLKTNDLRIAVELACQRQGITLATWLDEATLKGPHMKEYVAVVGPQGGQVRAAIVPDGYFHLQTPAFDFRFFLEVDRGTVTGQWDRFGRRSWARKILAYLAYYQSGGYERRYGSSKGRVLTVTVSNKRLAGLQAVTEACGGLDRFWFTTFERVRPETILTAPIWQKAGSPGEYALVR